MTRCRLLALFVALALPQFAAAADLDKAEWIWSAKFDRLTEPAGSQYFRKTFETGELESAKIEIVCDDAYELFINGQRVAEGHNWKIIDVHDLTKVLTPGRNLVAVHGTNVAFGPAGLAARLSVVQKDKQAVVLVTDATWKTSGEALPGWEKPGFNEDKWEAARSYGQFGLSSPWGDQPKKAGAPAIDPNRFTPLAGFKVEEVVTPGVTGSLVNMTFNERGDIIASRERGPLLLIRDLDHDGHFETVTTLSDEVTNCQGILSLNGHVFAVGTGPDGAGLYRLSDFDSEGRAHKVKQILKYRGVGMAEHGPHAAILGPDGLIYLIVGNHAGAPLPFSEKSPHHHFYEGELIEPKYEDANGHAVGIKSPGGTIVRTDENGSFVELFTGGFRNAFDFALNRDGEFFTWDADMEWDVGLPWYRPTRINHAIPGAEFGWRSGWSKWPDYYFDSLPATLDIGRGSPTGMEFYDHTRFPAKYHGALFMCDWSQGRILAAFLKPAGGTYGATSEVFLEGRPLNRSDIAVGPDGWLYFCVGGRNTVGSIFRVVSTDPAAVAPKPLRSQELMGGRVIPAIEQPQLQSAWSRRKVTEIRDALGNRWGKNLIALAEGAGNPSAQRVRALDLLQLFGPAPSAELLVKMSSDKDVPLRRKATYLLGLQGKAAAGARLVELLADSDPTVRRLACESLTRCGYAAPVEKLTAMLADPLPFVAWAARRAIEALPKADWQAAVLASENPRVFLQGAVAAVTLDGDRPTAETILAHAVKLLQSDKLSGNDLLDTLRVVELALYRGGFKPEELAALRSALSPKYPAATDSRVNRELVRLLVMSQEPTAAPRFVAQLAVDGPLEEKIHVAMYARFLQVGWTAELRDKLLEFYETTRLHEGGNSFRGYLTNAASDFLKSASPAEQVQFIARGATLPGVILRLVQALPDEPTAEQLTALRKLDVDLAVANKTAEVRELSKAVAAALARGDDAALVYLREQFENVPARRQEIAQSLALSALKRGPRPADLPLLTRALAVADGPAARDVLKALAKSEKPGDLKPEQLRQVILIGLRLQDHGGDDAVSLLERWTGEKCAATDKKADLLAPWQAWFRGKFPDALDPSLPVEAAGNKWTFAKLLDFINSDAGLHGNRERGAVIFEKANCIKCHRYGTRGEGIGPDLSNVAGRFQPKEILESVIYPSQVISDQFASKTVTTNSGLVYTGLVGPAGDGGVVVLQSNAEKVTVPKAEIDTIVPSKKSAMPEGLFNPLSLEEIADLFAYLSKPAGK